MAGNGGNGARVFPQAGDWQRIRYPGNGVKYKYRSLSRRVRRRQTRRVVQDLNRHVAWGFTLDPC